MEFTTPTKKKEPTNYFLIFLDNTSSSNTEYKEPNCFHVSRPCFADKIKYIFPNE